MPLLQKVQSFLLVSMLSTDMCIVVATVAIHLVAGCFFFFSNILSKCDGHFECTGSSHEMPKIGRLESNDLYSKSKYSLYSAKNPLVCLQFTVGTRVKRHALLVLLHHCPAFTPRKSHRKSENTLCWTVLCATVDTVCQCSSSKLLCHILIFSEGGWFMDVRYNIFWLLLFFFYPKRLSADSTSFSCNTLNA